MRKRPRTLFKINHPNKQRNHQAHRRQGIQGKLGSRRANQSLAMIPRRSEMTPNIRHLHRRRRCLRRRLQQC